MSYRVSMLESVTRRVKKESGHVTIAIIKWRCIIIIEGKGKVMALEAGG